MTAKKAGFDKCRAWTTAARTQPFAVMSYEIKRQGSYRTDTEPAWDSDIMAMLFQIWSKMVHIARPDSGEECILMAEK